MHTVTVSDSEAQLIVSGYIEKTFGVKVIAVEVLYNTDAPPYDIFMGFKLSVENEGRR